VTMSDRLKSCWRRGHSEFDACRVVLGACQLQWLHVLCSAARQPTSSMSGQLVFNMPWYVRPNRSCCITATASHAYCMQCVQYGNFDLSHWSDEC
jgi:hypothetical protein